MNHLQQELHTSNPMPAGLGERRFSVMTRDQRKLDRDAHQVELAPMTRASHGSIADLIFNDRELRTDSPITMSRNLPPTSRNRH
ncbi:hypothetical protein KC325_g262 [Hortaea werneckii]|nr:hypothetical protein KC325_g262 [Hortaea werneckii]